MSYYSGYSRTAPRTTKRRAPAAAQLPVHQQPRPEQSVAAAAPAVEKKKVAAVGGTGTGGTVTRQSRNKLSFAGRRGGPAGRRRLKATRPSLSEQLASIGAGADAITDGLRKRHGLEHAKSVLFATPSMLFVVGRLESKAPSPVAWHHDHCAYSFQHPFQRGTRIDMEMRYSDMAQPVLRSDKIGGHFFEFKICAPLSCYGIDYDPGKRDHKVRIRLASGTDAERVKRDILPRIRRR
jgi:hypothetical protein